MTWRAILSVFISIFITLSNTNLVRAEGQLAKDPSVTSLPKIVISEVQTNGASDGTANQEFIELYNYGDEVVDLVGWKLIYYTFSGSDSELFKFESSLDFAPNSFVVGRLASSPAEFLDTVEHHFVYEKGSYGLSATGGGLALLDDKSVVVDELNWTNAASSDEPRILGLDGGKSAQRYTLDEVFVGKEHEEPYIIEPPTPLALYNKITPVTEEAVVLVPEPISDPEPDPESVLPANPTLNPKVFLNEIFPDPASPLLDSKDEFIEIYNPHSIDVELTGYKIESESTTKYSEKIEDGVVIPAKGYYYITSSDSSITLANSGATVRLIDNLGAIIDEIVYGDSNSGEAWAKSATDWQWTITPTPGQANVIMAPVLVQKAKQVKATPKITKSDSNSSKTSKKTNFTTAPPIKINEIFPDPKSPQTDAKDEFIELYNPHPFEINIADYTVTSGATKVYKHVIAENTTVPAFGYYTLRSEDTSLSLTNSGGRVTLINNFDKEIDMVEYPEAISGESWAFVGGKWQWTSSPTPSAVNKLSVSSASTKNSNSSNKTTVASAKVAGTDDTPLVPAPQPLPGWLLVVLGVSAVCYATYEYRFEARNIYNKRRTIRSSR